MDADAGGGEEPGRTALAALDRAIARAPEKDGHDFAAATEALATLRDRLIAEHGDRERLGQVNAILSIVVSAHFPLGNIPWDSVRTARARLAELLATP